jgi:ABC-type antimicrobial peptide transport system permease subunit
MVLLSLFSLVPGAALSWAANAYLAGVGWSLPHPFTYGGMVFSTMYGDVSWQVFLLPAALVVSMAFLVSLPAAWRIRKLTAIEALGKA